jgi:hypothetical protein
VATIARAVRLTAAESFWYVLQCVYFGAGYFAKVPVKKALAEAGLTEMTGAEQFWYVLQCIAFGAGYLAKVPVKKALSEMTRPADPGYQPAARPDYHPEHGRPAQAPDYADLPDRYYQPQAPDYADRQDRYYQPQAPDYADRQDGYYQREAVDYGQQQESLPPSRPQGVPPGRHQGRHRDPRQPGY